MRRCFGAILASLLWLAGGEGALALDEVSFGTDWKAEAEHGGYYQAIATGIYRKYGLEVHLRQGGPQVNQTLLLAGGRLDFVEAANSFIPLNAAAERIPLVAVASRNCVLVPPEGITPPMFCQVPEITFVRVITW